MKNICFCGHYTAGGTERAAFMIANGLCRDYNVFLINTCDREPAFKLDDSLHMDYLRGGNILLRILALAGYLRRNRIDILITVEAMTGIYTILAAKLAGCKHIIWEHANYFQTQGSSKIQKIRQLELKAADAYICLTERDVNNFRTHFKIKTRLDYIYNAMEEAASAVYDTGSKKLISMGHIRPIKNFIVIPDIAKKVFAKHPDWTWEIYGAVRGECAEALKKKITEYVLEDKVILCGRTDAPDEVYSSAAMYVMTSLQEGLPMVLLEAKAHRLPIVSFDIETGPSEIVDNGVNGYLIKPYDTDEMAERICFLIENDELRKRFSDAAMLGTEKFEIKGIIDKWKMILNEI